MKQYFKRIVAVVLCIAVCFSFFVVPSYATVSDAFTYTVETFTSFIHDYITKAVNVAIPQYLTGIADALLNGTATDVDIQNAYDTYVNDMQSYLGTYVITNNGIRLYQHYSSISGQNYSFSSRTNTNPYEAIFQFNTSYPNAYISLGFGSLTLPFATITTRGIVVEADNCIVEHPTFNAISVSANTAFGSMYVTIKPQTINTNASVYLRPYVDIVPYTGVIQDYYSDVDITPSNRMTSILPSIYNNNITNTTNQYHLGTVENNAVTNVYDTNIFNETTNVFTVPGDTPTTYNITDWTYDYSTRTYVCVDSDSNVYIVQYGDDAVHVTVPDGSGGTTSYTYYYIYQEPVPSPGNTDDTTTFPGTSSDNYDDDPNTTGGFWSTIWKAFKDGLADLIAGIVKDLFKGLKAIISGILNVFSGLVTGFFDAVNSFFNSFSETGVFQFWNGTVTDLS